jgi:hypothetical protein
MTILALFALVSFVAMIAMIAPKVALVRKEEIVHNGHVGIRTVMQPLLDGLRSRFAAVFGKVWTKIAPFAQFVVYKGGTFVHIAAVTLAKKLLGIAERIQGKQVLRNSSQVQFPVGMAARRRG